jgi:hypothetical protein
MSWPLFKVKIIILVFFKPLFIKINAFQTKFNFDLSFNFYKENKNKIN